MNSQNDYAYYPQEEHHYSDMHSYAPPPHPHPHQQMQTYSVPAAAQPYNPLHPHPYHHPYPSPTSSGGSGILAPSSPTGIAVGMQLPPSPSPASPYPPVSPPMSGSESAESVHNMYPRTSASPPLRGGGGGGPHRHARHPAPPASPPYPRRAPSADDLSDDADAPPPIAYADAHFAPPAALASTRKEATRRQRIEAEQRRRDELRDGYGRLKEVLPVSNQKSSKVSLLDRATVYISSLDQTVGILQGRLATLEDEIARLRDINESLSLSVAQHTGQLPTEVMAAYQTAPPAGAAAVAEEPHAPQPVPAHAEMYHVQRAEPAPHHHHQQHTDSSAGGHTSGSDY